MMGMAGTAGSSGRELWRCVGCDAPASCTTPCVPLPRGQGGQKGVRCPSEEIPSLLERLRRRQLPAKALFVDRVKFAISWFGYNEFSL